MKASEKWRRVRPVEMTPIGVGVTCSATKDEAFVTIGIRRDVPRLREHDLGWESFQITGTPEEMEALAKKLQLRAQDARNMLATNRA